jgi:hypothetical protein
MDNQYPIARAEKLLREALLSDHLTPYAESRIRGAIIALRDAARSADLEKGSFW